MAPEPQEPPTPDLHVHDPHLQDSTQDRLRSSSAPPELLNRPHQQDPVLFQLSACQEATSGTGSEVPTNDVALPVYHRQQIHHSNTFRNNPASIAIARACPPAGNTVYPLDSRITATHRLFVDPPQFPCDSPPKYLNFGELVGDPGIRNGTQNRRVEDWRQVPEGNWSHPSTFDDGVPTWEAIQRTGTSTLHHQLPPSSFAYPKSSTTKKPSDQSLAVAFCEEEHIEEADVVQTPVYKPPKRRPGKRKSTPSKKLLDEQAVKRVKNKRIERPFIIGSEAWPLDETNTRKPDTPEEHTKGWRVYVKVPSGQPEITTWLRKVQFKIFHTYTNPTRMVEEPPFQIEETGWGGFTVEVKLFFVPEVGARPQDRSHFLQLEPYGTEAEQEKQKKEKMVRSELLDYVEFNEPTETMFDILTSEDQFKATKTGKGKGKAKLKREEGEEGTVALPEASSESNQYSKELEQQLLDILKKAESQVDEQLETEMKKAKALEERLKALQPTPAAPTTATATTTTGTK